MRMMTTPEINALADRLAPALGARLALVPVTVINGEEFTPWTFWQGTLRKPVENYLYGKICRFDILSVVERVEEILF